MGWTVNSAKNAFIGREACLDMKDETPGKKLVCLTLEDSRATLLGYEPIYRNSCCIGHITSSNYGYSIGKVIAYGYLPAEHASIGTELEVRYMGQSFPAIVAAEPLFDPQSKRMKADLT